MEESLILIAIMTLEKIQLLLSFNAFGNDFQIQRLGEGDNTGGNRTGHNIGQETHGNGAHMDNLETKEERLVMPRTCFSIEPGVYREDFGIRSEINVYVDADSKVHVTGGVQTEVLPILG